MNLIYDYDRANNVANWCWKNAVQPQRMKRVSLTVRNLVKRVASFLEIDHSVLTAEKPSRMPEAKLAILRIINVWVFHDGIIEMSPGNFVRGLSREENTFTMDVQRRSDPIEESHLKQILGARHPFQLKGYSEYLQHCHFETSVSGSEYLKSFEERLMSYLAEKGIPVAWVSSGNYYCVFVAVELSQRSEFSTLLGKLEERLDESHHVVRPFSGKKRGRAERACGLWTVHDQNSVSNTTDEDQHWLKYCTQQKTPSKNKVRYMNERTRL